MMRITGLRLVGVLLSVAVLGSLACTCQTRGHRSNRPVCVPPGVQAEQRCPRLLAGKARELIGTYTGWPFLHEFTWLILSEDGTFFWRGGAEFHGPWHYGWRGDWSIESHQLLLHVTEKDTGDERGPADGVFTCRLSSDKITIQEFPDGEAVPANVAVCEFVLRRAEHPTNLPRTR